MYAVLSDRYASKVDFSTDWSTPQGINRVAHSSLRQKQSLTAAAAKQSRDSIPADG